MTSHILKGLNSSLTQSATELWLCKVQQQSGACGTKRVKLVARIFVLQLFFFFTHNFYQVGQL